MRVRLIIFLLLLTRTFLLAQTNSPVAEPIVSERLHNLFSVGDLIFSGSSPSSDGSFQELRKLGVKTIISVDGSKPDVESARRHGLRYIHIPIGYDGTTLSNAQRIARAAEISERPIYVHCHHGKHRGPAAVAVICQGLGWWDTNQALGWMNAAGASPDYPGLFGMASNFRKPSRRELASIPSNFPEQAPVSGVVEAMVEIDARWGRLRAFQKAAYKIPPEQNNFAPAKEALLLMEVYRELRRAPAAREFGQDFLDRLESAKRDAAALHAFLSPAGNSVNPVLDKNLADDLWSRNGRACAACHKKHRDDGD